MAVYTFECGVCGAVVDRVFGMMEVGKRRRVKCACGGKMARVYGRPQVNPDTWGRPRELGHLYSLTGDPLDDVPAFETRTAERRYKEEHQRRFGWS